jgi:hypothetical protein
LWTELAVAIIILREDISLLYLTFTFTSTLPAAELQLQLPILIVLATPKTIATAISIVIDRSAQTWRPS